MRLGVFGGSFDPVHYGHLALAGCCQQQAELDQVWFLPAATQPLKQAGPVATDDHRLVMLDLATADTPEWHVSRLEIDRGGVSYTVDTLRQLHNELPEAELFFMMGADALHDLPTWYEPAEICRLATPLVVARAGEPVPDFDVLREVCSPERVDAIRQMQVNMDAMPISSTELRRRIAAGEPVADMLPPAVEQYIADNGLYQLAHD